MIWKQLCRTRKRLFTALALVSLGCIVTNLFLAGNAVGKNPGYSCNVQNTLEVTTNYLQFTYYDIPGGDMSCNDVKHCTSNDINPEQAKLLCHKDPSCKGFASTSSSGVYFKKDVTGIKMIPKSNVTLYIKSEYAHDIILQMVGHSNCAVPVSQPISSNVTVHGCNMAEFDPFDRSMLQHLKKPDLPLKCDGQRFSRYRDGVLTFNDKDSKVSKVEVIPITRPSGDDFNYIEGSSISVDYPNSAILKHEFIRVETTTQDGQKHTEYHAAVVPKPDVVARPRKTTGIPVNVMIVGMDSMSNAHFQRTLPKAYKYLKEDLKSIILKGYTIVGDGTTPALTAMLTGYFEKELPEARHDFPGSEPVDNWPWLIKDFSKAGYATMFSEDEPNIASWNYRLKGFTDQPTDHFSRYFWLAAKYTKPHCIHGKPQHLIHLDYIETLFEAYTKTPKFGFAFFSGICHDKQGSVYLMGDDFYAFLKNFEKRLNDTILIVLSDHGFRFGKARGTLQGQLEERLPFISFTLPSWFENKYPNMVKNLRHNVQSVTSPFDMHLTLRHLLTYPDKPKPNNNSRGMSLFENIPGSRDCGSAGVMDHYCPCLSLKPADRGHNHIQASGKALVKHINEMLSRDEFAVNLCHQLELHEILSSQQQMPNTKFQKFLGPADIHGRVPKFATSEEISKAHECNYRIQVRTTPGDGLFEAAVQFRDFKFIVKSDISRINKYGDQPRCILDKNRDLRKYCLCKNQVRSTRPS